MPDPRPDEIRARSFDTSLRGFRPADVQTFLAELAAEVQDLLDERDRLRELADQTGRMDLESEFERIGKEVGEVLQAARSAAEGIRTRASDDAAMLTAKTRAEAEVTLREAQQQAEALRGDAWDAAEALLSQSLAERDRVRQETERERLAVIGRAERDAHRLVANARQEADEMIRQAKMESERLVVDARARHDDIIEQARASAETAQERAAALERRRTELLGELESVRATVSRLESDIQEKREELEAVEAVRETDETAAESAPDEPDSPWGDAIRVIRPSELVEPEEIDATDVAEEVRTLRERDREPVPEPDGSSEDRLDTDREPDTGTDNGLDSLFASLRGEDPAETAPEATASAHPTDRPDQAAGTPPEREATESEEATKAPAAPSADDVDVDQLLLPITNRVLRDIKRQLTEAQNVALDGLRVDEGEWAPDRADLVDRLGGYLTIVAQESYAAGFAATEHYSGSSPGRPKPTTDELGDPVTDFTDNLADALTDAVDGARQAGQGPRQLSATVSRIYRGWRTDEAERRVRTVAVQAFRAGLARGLADSDVDPADVLHRMPV